jgi:hypothetical protein
MSQADMLIRIATSMVYIATSIANGTLSWVAHVLPQPRGLVLQARESLSE